MASRNLWLAVRCPISPKSGTKWQLFARFCAISLASLQAGWSSRMVVDGRELAWKGRQQRSPDRAGSTGFVGGSSVSRFRDLALCEVVVNFRSGTRFPRERSSVRIRVYPRPNSYRRSPRENTGHGIRGDLQAKPNRIPTCCRLSVTTIVPESGAFPGPIPPTAGSYRAPGNEELVKGIGGGPCHAVIMALPWEPALAVLAQPGPGHCPARSGRSYRRERGAAPRLPSRGDVRQ